MKYTVIPKGIKIESIINQKTGEALAYSFKDYLMEWILGPKAKWQDTPDDVRANVELADAFAKSGYAVGAVVENSDANHEKAVKRALEADYPPHAAVDMRRMSLALLNAANEKPIAALVSAAEAIPTPPDSSGPNLDDARGAVS